jgi:hypothetical protein
MDIEFINMSLEYYDNQISKYHEYWALNPYIDNEKGFIDFSKNDKLEKKEQYEILGVLDKKENVFIWSWLFPVIESKFTIISRNLLNYALSLEPKSNTYEHYFLKTSLLNSRIFIENSEQLDILLSISSFLIKNKSKFIIPIDVEISKSNFLTIFYIIKNI